MIRNDNLSAGFIQRVLGFFEYKTINAAQARANLFWGVYRPVPKQLNAK